MSLIRGVLLAGKFRTHLELNQMSPEDQRNTLIVELTKHSNQRNYQSFDDNTLAGMGAVLVFLRATGLRDDSALARMSADDQRNTVIVEMGIQHPHLAARLQGFSNMELVLTALGRGDPNALAKPSYLRGVLLAGRFRSQHELNAMSPADQRNTLIVELTKRSRQFDYQTYDDYTLAGMGAALVFLREQRIRTDNELKMMTADDHRNTLIVEVDKQTRLGPSLQSLSNVDLVRLALGVHPNDVFITIQPPLRPRPRQALQFRLRGFTVFTSNDSLFQGARDEVYVSAIGMDSSTAHRTAEGTLVVDKIEGPVVGDVADGAVTGPWATDPFVLLEFDVDRDPSDPELIRSYPRTYVATLLVVEEDNAGINDTFKELKDKVKDAATDAIKSAAASSLGEAGASGVGPLVGAAVGAFAGYLAGLALDQLFAAIGEGLDNEVLSPKSLKFTLPHPIGNLMPDDVDRPDWFEIRERGAYYRILYDWHIELR